MGRYLDKIRRWEREHSEQAKDHHSVLRENERNEKSLNEKDEEDSVSKSREYERNEKTEKSLPGSDVLIEPAAASPRPIYFETADGQIKGPVIPELLAMVGPGPRRSFWIVTTFEGCTRWIRSDRLRAAAHSPK